jgi:hypothetical protein
VIFSSAELAFPTCFGGVHSKSGRHEGCNPSVCAENSQWLSLESGPGCLGTCSLQLAAAAASTVFFSLWIAAAAI